MSRISLDEQIAGLERAVMNLRGSIEILQDLVEKKKRDGVELKIQEGWLPQLESALETMRWLKKNEERIKSALHQKS